METWILLAVIAIISIVSVLFYVFILKPQHQDEIKETETSDIPDHVCNYDRYHEQTNDFTVYFCSVCGENMGTFHDYYDGDPRND